MKTFSSFLFTCLIFLFFSGCHETITDRYLVNTPIYMSKEDFKKSVSITDPEEIVNPGKIYFKDNYIFINEPQKGIHVIDNNDPSNPEIVSFIEIPGNVDMAIKDSILFADSFVDLVALDISNIQNITEVGRVDSIFPYALPPIIAENNLPIANVDASMGIVVGWEVTEVEEEITSRNPGFGFFPERSFLEFSSGANSRISMSDASGSSMSVGIGGSMARFTIADNFLYTIDQSNLRTFDIDEIDTPLLISDQSIGWGVETVFQYRHKLFFGTQTGMLIYDLNNPARPDYISRYDHIKSCDPVVVEGDYAYVTLRAGNLCGEATSQLDIIDVSNISSPKWEQSYPMQEPYGLGIDNSILFICDGEAGLKVYDANDPHDLIKIAWFPEVRAFDVIPYNGLLMMIGSDGLYQYDYSGEQISLLSEIGIGREE